MKLFRLILLTVVFMLSFQEIFTFEFVTMIDDYEYRGSLSTNHSKYYQYYISSDRLVVFTLKNLSNRSDLDIYFYIDPAMDNPVEKGTNSDTKPELKLISLKNVGCCVYIKIENCGKFDALFRLYVHEIDFSQLLTESLVEMASVNLLEAIFNSDDERVEGARNKARTANTIINALKGKNLSEMGEELLINEVTTIIQEKMGDGFWGNYAVRCAAKFIRKIYKYN